MTLPEFLLARIAEDEADARRIDYDPFVAQIAEATFSVDHPLRLLAECEAKRQIVERAGELGGRTDFEDGEAWESDRVLRDLASAYADHPDYRQEWRP